MLVTARGQAVMLAPCKGLSLLQRELAGTCVLSARWVCAGLCFWELKLIQIVKNPAEMGLGWVCAMPADGDCVVCLLCPGRPANLLSFLVFFVCTK